MPADDLTAATVREPFTDAVSGRECVLVIPPGGRIYPGSREPQIGVEHPGCDRLADLEVDLDAFFCRACHFNGRVSGYWCMDVIGARL